MQTIFMAFITGTIDAVDFYCRAFGATAENCFKAADGDDFYAHAEIVRDGRTFLALSERAHYGRDFTNGDSAEFWVIFDDEASLNQAYAVLGEDADIHEPLGPCEWCRALASLTDKYGVNWLLSAGY